jgi:uncharacterized ParB-like nuclease family protein
MALPTGSGGRESGVFCGFCGYSDAQGFTFCPRCGRPAGGVGEQVILNEQTRPSVPLMPETGGTFGSSPTQAGMSPSGALNQFPPTMPAGTPSGGFYGPQGWQQGPAGGYAPGGPQYAGGGYAPQGYPYAAGMMSGQVGTGAPAKQRWSRRKRMSVVTAALVALLLVGTAGAYFVYSAFFAYSPTDSARYLPASTLFYSSFDLQQVAQNSHGVTQKDVAGTTNTSGFEQETGLDFQKDVAPWIKRSFSFSLVSISTQQAPSRGGFGTVFLIATHDTNASNATLQKIMRTQEQKYGVTFTSISYKGTTLQSDVDSVQNQPSAGFGRAAAAPLVLGIVKDQVIIASTVAVAEGVVDRANGNTDTLANDATFTRAMGKLPGGRFGTLYLNVSELLRDLKLVSNGSGATGLDSYPVGYGSLQFTDVGMRMQFTLEAKAGTKAGANLAGDTNASAGVVPGNAILYAGLGNVSGLYQALKDASGGAVTDDGFTKTVGLAPGDPLFDAPLSVALLPPQAGSDEVVEPLVMLHSSLDTATTSAKVAQAIETLGYKTSASTVNGVAVTGVQNKGQTVYYAVLGHDVVFAYDRYGMSQAIETFQGQITSLAGQAAFKRLIAQAPKTNALTLFVSLENLAKASGQLGSVYRQLTGQNAFLGKVTAMYLTYRSDNSGITITEDIALK